MKIERRRPTRYVVELHPYDLARLMAAARWAVEAGGHDLPIEAVQELERIIASYDDELARMGAATG